MNRSLHYLKLSATTLALLVLVFSPFSQLVSVAHAEPGPTAADPAFDPRAAAASNTNNSNTAATNNTNNQQQPSGGVDNNSNIGCNLSTLVGNVGGTFALCLTNIVYIFSVGIGSGFTYVAAYFFDWAVNISLNSASYALTFISEGWATARDIANMAFLFILLYIAFVIMFQADTVGTVQMLTTVVVVALLVNFSFFFTRVAIDAGNIFAIQFYNAIQAPSINQTVSSATSSLMPGQVEAKFNQAFGSGNSKDLTAAIMGMLQLQNLFGTDSFNAFFNGQNGQAKSGFMVTTIALSFLYIAAAIMFWLLTVAFVANGVKFLVRVVVLWFLIIASPLAFVARAIPKFEQYFHRWMEELIKHAFYPVAFMFIFLILSNFASQMSESNGLINGIFNSLQSANTSSSAVAAIGYAVANVGIRLGLVIAVLYIGLRASEAVGVMGAEMAKSASNWVSNRYIGASKRTATYAGRATAAAPAWLGRNTIGLGLNAAANSSALRKMETRAGLVGLAGRGLRAATGAVGRASFDVRNAPIVGKGLSDTLGLGKGQKGGYEADLKNTIERKEKRMKSVEPSLGQKDEAAVQAKKETGYDVQEKIFNEAQNQVADADARLKQLIANGREDTPDARNLKLEKIASEANMHAAKKKMENLKPVMERRAKEISGEGLSKKYADTMTTPNIRNLWNVVNVPPGASWRGSKEAAAKIRHGESDAEKAWKAMKKEMEKEAKEKTEKEHAENTASQEKPPEKKEEAQENH